jgi:hypothetical protein
MFSGAIKLADIDDYINPNKDCNFIKHLVSKIKQKSL